MITRYVLRLLILAAILALTIFVLSGSWSAALHGQPETSSYDAFLDAGYGIIRYQGHTMLVKAEFARTYLAVAYCESGYDEKAEGALGERGFLQIHPVHKDRIERLGYTWDDMYTLWPNLVVAYDIWLDSESWEQWSCE